mgnify:CR=1 FL=1
MIFISQAPTMTYMGSILDRDFVKKFADEFMRLYSGYNDEYIAW